LMSRQKIARRPRPAEDIDKPAAFAHTKKTQELCQTSQHSGIRNVENADGSDDPRDEGK